MKKTLTLLILLLTVGMMAEAQNLSSKLVGTWTANVPDDGEMKNCMLTLTVNGNGTAIFRMRAQVISQDEDGSTGDIKFSFSINGKWTQKDVSLKLVNDINSIKVKVKSMFIDGIDAKDFIPMAESSMIESFKGDPDTYQEMLIENIKFTGQNTFTAQFDGNDLTFRRKINQ